MFKIMAKYRALGTPQVRWISDDMEPYDFIKKEYEIIEIK